MSSTVFQQVADAMAAAIDTVEAGDTYAYTLTAIRPKRLNISGNETADGASVISLGQAVERQDECTNTTQAWTLDVIVEIAAVESDSSTDPIEDRLAKMAADAWTAVAATIADGAALEGLAQQVSLKSVAFMINVDGPYASCTFEVLVWTAFGDLYTVAN